MKKLSTTMPFPLFPALLLTLLSFDAIPALGRDSGSSETCPVLKPTLPDRSLKIQLNLEYLVHGNRKLHIDIYAPQGEGPYPSLLLIHGGGWMQGSRKDVASLAKTLASQGYVTAAVQHRLATPSANQFPAAVEDVRCAVQWLRKNSEALRIDPDHIGAVGGSSGGHLASMLGTAAQASGLDSPACSANEQRVDVSLVVSVAGPQDIEAMSRLTRLQRTILRTFLGSLPSENPELARRASPAQYVDAFTPPFLLIHGDADTLVPVEQSRWMRDKLQATGREVEYIEVAGRGHSIAASPPACPIAGFLLKHLSSPATKREPKQKAPVP